MDEIEALDIVLRLKVRIKTAQLGWTCQPLSPRRKEETSEQHRDELWTLLYYRRLNSRREP